ncbi:MAG: hypothetical protein LAT52_12835, partial [Balneolales bacterium]|nr:hypothetical protein [Balneolales bacterium]
IKLEALKKNIPVPYSPRIRHGDVYIFDLWNVDPAEQQHNRTPSFRPEPSLSLVSLWCTFRISFRLLI